MSNLLSCKDFRRGPEWAATDGKELKDGDSRVIDKQCYVYFDGCWIRYYEPPPNTLENKRSLITHLTRRTFHHTESGINTPGDRLQQARRAFDSETDPDRKRVNAAMLSGALFNHATDIFTAIVELEAKGVGISRSNELMKECGACFKEALELGSQVKHYSGEEGIDELWGEPFRAFTISIDQFYKSRYIKIAQTWHNLDKICESIENTFEGFPAFANVSCLISAFTIAAKCESETMKSDESIFFVWPQFISAGERLANFYPEAPSDASNSLVYALREGHEIINRGKKLIDWISGARVPMPKSTKSFEKHCAEFRIKLEHCYNKQK